MRPRYLFLLVYLLGSCFGASSAQRNATCTSRETCSQVPDSTSHFLQCVGLPSTDTGRDHMRRLKGMLEASMDVYTFMRSSATGVPLLSLQGALELNPEADPLHNEALVQMWMEVKMKPLLKSITKHFLSCLSTKNFSCSTYQTVVRELSHHYSEMNPARQKWIYTFFMYPFLSGDRVAGCVRKEEGSEEWLMKNFGAFSAMARMEDFSALNMVFSGLEVLHLLSPAQKAELLLMPEVASLDNGTLSLVFHSLLTGGSGPPPTAGPGWGNNWTISGYPYSYPPPKPPQNSFREVANRFMTAFRPIGSFVHDFVSFTQERDVSEIRSTTLTQFLLNWTLAELADIYRPQIASVLPERPKFDVTNVEDWYQQVVMPVLRRFLTNGEDMMHQNIKLAFHEVFYLDHMMDNDNETSEDLDVCSITLDKRPCGLTDAVENVAHVLHCAARTNLTMSEETIMRLIEELTKRLNSLIKELSTANFREVASDFQEIFGEADSPSMTRENLQDPNFIKLWFQIKLMPLLPDVPIDLLSCLSTKNFSCQVYQTIVAELSKHMHHMHGDLVYGRNIYEHFIYPFLLNQYTTGPSTPVANDTGGGKSGGRAEFTTEPASAEEENEEDEEDEESGEQDDKDYFKGPWCISSANHSAEWLKNNFGFFSRFASITDFYKLNPHFSGLEVLHLLSPRQIAEMLLLPLPIPPEKDIAINQVFDFLLEFPEHFPEVLHSLVELAGEVNPPCDVYKHIFERLYAAIPSLPRDMEPITWAGIDELIDIAPEECVPENIACPVTQYNDTEICRGINSSGLHSYLSHTMEVSCNFTLDMYACAQLENFTANHLVSLLKCDLPGDSNHSKMLWKLLLTKLSAVLDPVLDMLANMSMPMLGPSALDVLDVIGELRVEMLTDEQLMNSSVIRKWFHGRLNAFLPSASGRFLHCLTSRNLSCHSYQQILQVFIHHFDNMTMKQQHVVFKNFVLRFLSHSGPGCVSLANNSAEWLMKNLGPFSRFLSIEELLYLNPHFNPLEVLRLLTPKQSAELLVLTLPTLPDKDVIINMLFDHLTESPDVEKLPEFLSYLVMLLPLGNLSCSSYKTLFNRLDMAMTTVSPDVASHIPYSKAALSNVIPPGCIIYSGECTFTMTNETDICAGVNSTMLQLHLDSGRMKGRFCDFTVEEFACASLSALKAEDLAAMLACNHSSYSSSSRPVWKLLLSKASHVLDEALDLLTNMTLDPRNPAVSVVLDSVREIRLDTFSLNHPAIIQLWFKNRLRPFLPAVSPEFLSCLTTKGLNCSTYLHLVQILSGLMPHMTPSTQMSVYTHFVKVFLMSNDTAGPGCVSLANNSAEWLMKNLGPFSRFLSIEELLHLNPHLNPLEVLRLLTPKQSAELLVLTLPTLPDKDVIINMLFDHLTESPDVEKLPEFLSYLVMLLPQGNLSCSSYKTLFNRLDLAMTTVSLEVASQITHSQLALSKHLPPGCIIYSGECTFTMTNETDICAGVNSTMLQLHLDSGRMKGRFCDFTVEEFACASLSALKAEDLAAMLACNHSSYSSSSRPVWKLLLSKASHVLDEALDLLTNMTLDPRNPAVSVVLDSVREIRLDKFSLNHPAIIQLWFKDRLRPFLPAVSLDFLSCLTTKGLNCSTYQHLVQILSGLMPHMTPSTQMSVYTHFMKVFLTRNDTAGPGCVSLANNSAEWLMKNLGPFSRFLSIEELLHLNPHFNPLEVLRLLTPKQSAELLVLTLPTLPDKDVIINMLFDHLTESPDVEKLPEFLSYLVMLLPQGNLSCSSYKTLFNRLDLAMTTVSLEVASQITHSQLALSKHLPPGCIIYSGECTFTMTNETDICAGVNSTMLQLHLDSGRMKGRFCDFTVEEFACASLSALKAEDLAAMLACNHSSYSSSSRPVWKLLLSKASHVLDEALDLLTNMTLDPRNPAVSVVLDSVREIRLDKFSPTSLNHPAIIQLWFKDRLRPFLPAVSLDFLSCLTTKGLNCSTYQHLVQILSGLMPHMTPATQMSVYTHFMKVFLTRNDTADSSCSVHITDSGEWVHKNLGAFSVLASFQDLQMLYSSFTAMEALPQLTVRQLAEVSSTPGQLTSPAQVTMVMNHITNQHLPAFFDDFSPAIMGHENMFPAPVRSAMLQVVFDRANLSDHSVGESVVLLWLRNRLHPLLVNLSPNHVAPFFGILAGRNCSIEQQGVQDLNSTISSLSEQTQKEIHNHIVQSLKGPIPLNCYGDNYNHSFYSFLERSFLGFQFPNLTTFLSLMPHNRMHQLVNSMPPSHLGDFLRRPDVVDNDAELCVIYSNYVQTPTFLEAETLPAVVQRPTLPCVWPTALSSSSRSEVDAWFDRRLNNYFGFLTQTLISPSSTHNASCLAFQKLVLVLGEYNYTAADFMRRDMFNTIRAYLTSATVPRCYNSSDAELNSTAWFAEYIGAFMPFLTLEDLQTFGSAQVIQVFTVNPLNLALLNHSTLPLNLTNYYTELIYQQDSNFNPLLLPLLCRCVVPGPAFSQLTAQESVVVLHNLTTLCTDVDPQVSAALAGNLGDNIDATAISALGSESTGLSTGQIMMIRPADILSSLTVLSSVQGWNEGQAKAIIVSLTSSGMLQFNSSSLVMLGSLLVGVPSTMFSTISGSQLLDASKNPSFLGHLVNTPQTVQETFVTQIISVSSNSETIIQNVPDELATEIPRIRLLGFSSSSTVITTLNRKSWKHKQAELFFGVLAVETATATLGSPNNLSSSVLQGFTCTAVRVIETRQIRRLVRACRRRGRNKVTLVETQLTCMYNHIKGDLNATNFNLYPHDMLLYYDYSMVPQASCRSYFEQLAEADFSVFSSALRYKLTALFANARSCLGITNTSLTEDNISVLGNMCCTLDGSYIKNSDPSILEKLKNCPDLTNAQATAVETLLQSGKTPYGAPSTWNEKTLKDLGMLPLYLTSTFYVNFDKQTKRNFLKYFQRVLRNNKVGRRKRKRMKREIRRSNRRVSKRSIVNECTVGEITQVTISDETFPFDYDDITQFNCCLSAKTVKDNLDSITEKVDEEEYLTIVLSKLREAYAANSTIPESQVQLLGPASRVATIDDINKWSITQIDTLSALMDSSDGEWDPSLAKAIISKYLSEAGNKLGSTELNAIGGPNLCSLDVNILKSISQESLRNADTLTVSNCTTEKKKALFDIAREAFATNTRMTTSVDFYQLAQSYLEGANVDDIRSLVSSNVNMDMNTFTSLDENVVLDLTVTEVKGLLGTNLPDLKSYENQTLVQSWISRQFQSELDTLGVSLTGGRADSTATTKSPAATTNSPASTTKSPSLTTKVPGNSQVTTAAGSGGAGSTSTTGHGSRIQADAGLSFLVLLALLITSQHILV